MDEGNTSIDSTVDPRPRIVMVLANEFLHDTRVHKEARSLIEWGCDVTIIALARPGLPAHEVKNEIDVHRVAPVPRSLWRLAVAALFWWCPPILGWLFRRFQGFGRRDDAQPAGPRGPVRRFAGFCWRKLKGATRLGLRVGRFCFGSPAVYAVVRRTPRLVARVARVARQGRRAVKSRLPSSLRLLAFNVECATAAIPLAPDVVVAHDLNTLAAGVVIKRLTGAPLVYDSHELYLERNLGHRSRGRDKLVWAPIEWLCIGRCDAVLSVADGICRHLARQYGIPKPHLVRNTQPYEPPVARTRLLSDELGIDHDRPIVLYPGAITINRGLEAMIDSAADLDDAVYVIMGYARNPAYLEGLRERARERGVLDDRLYFQDAVPIDDVLRYTASADLGIVPTPNICLSYYYESSNKIFHCLMAGVPLVMSDHAEKRLLVEQYDIGVLFDETDVPGIARAVNATLADREGYDRMCHHCLAASRELNWEHEEYKLRSVFARLLGPRAHPVPAVSLPVSEAPIIEVVRAEPAISG